MTKTIDALTAQTMEESKRCARKMSLLQELTSLKEKYGAVFDEVLESAAGSVQKRAAGDSRPRTGMASAIREWMAAHPEGGSARVIADAIDASSLTTSPLPATTLQATLNGMHKRGELVKRPRSASDNRVWYVPVPSSELNDTNSETEAEGET